MIIEWFAALGAGFIEWVSHLFDGIQVPSWLTDQHGALVTMLDSFNGLGVWVDWTALGICVGAVLVSWTAAAGIKGLRWFIGLFPTMGGGS